MLLKSTIVVNFINILRAHFLYKSPFFAKTKLEKSTFVWKTQAYNIAEIDTCTLQFDVSIKKNPLLSDLSLGLHPR